MRSRHVGFSGTQLGMTQEQKIAIDAVLGDDLITQFAHHGDCIGADAEFHHLAKLNGLWVVGHPPINPAKRAFCEFDSEREPKEYIERNHDIVKDADWMLFTPKGFVEELRSGTWSTVRYARKREATGLIVWPDGKATGINERR